MIFDTWKIFFIIRLRVMTLFILDLFHDLFNDFFHDIFQRLLYDLFHGFFIHDLFIFYEWPLFITLFMTYLIFVKNSLKVIS